MDRALPHYEALYGPFTIADYSIEGVLYRGKTTDCRLRCAFSRSSPIEIELIEVLEGETAHTEHLRRHGEGLHHVRFRVDDVDAKLAVLTGAGFETLLYKRFAPTLAFAYLATPPEQGGSVIELFEDRS